MGSTDSEIAALHELPLPLWTSAIDEQPADEWAPVAEQRLRLISTSQLTRRPHITVAPLRACEQKVPGLARPWLDGPRRVDMAHPTFLFFLLFLFSFFCIPSLNPNLIVNFGFLG